VETHAPCLFNRDIGIWHYLDGASDARGSSSTPH
jgi:hypothetical protein